MSRIVRTALLLALLPACASDGERELGDTLTASGGDSESTQTSAEDESEGDSASPATTETGDSAGGTETGGDGDGDAPPGFCGDGIVSDSEVCDDGINDGSYGGCNPGCMSLAAYCGDGVVNGPEGCDDADEDSTDGCMNACVMAESCRFIHELEPDLDDGFYTLIPPGLDGDPFQVYCDMNTQGGGWAVIFKNHGGADPGELSNDMLLDGDPGAYGVVILPHTIELASGINPEAWAFYRDDPGHEWLKLGTLYSPEDEIVHEQAILADFGEAVTWSWILSRPSSEPCHLAANAITVTLNGDTPLGQTTYVNSYQSERRTFGLANSNEEDRCGQLDSNIITDPDQNLAWLGGHSMGGIRHFFSYVHTESGTNASRCQFACWSDASAGYYDGFTWLVR